MPGSCLFCDFVADRRKVPHWIAESPLALAFVDIRPIRHGHSLVIPKRHAVDLSDVRPEDLRGMMELVQTVAARLRQRLGTDGENLMVASGPGLEQSVFHLHVHVIPRKRDDDLRWNDWWQTKAYSPSFAEIEGLARSIRE